LLSLKQLIRFLKFPKFGSKSGLHTGFSAPAGFSIKSEVFYGKEPARFAKNTGLFFK
jgi:hypothetical protein